MGFHGTEYFARQPEAIDQDDCSAGYEITAQPSQSEGMTKRQRQHLDILLPRFEHGVDVAGRSRKIAMGKTYNFRLTRRAARREQVRKAVQGRSSELDLGPA